MSSEPILCSVEGKAFGAPPRRARIEARKLSQGFEVWFRDDHLCPDGEVIATGDTHYNAQTFCEIMSDYFTEYKRMDVPPDAWREANVSGERGLKAYMLALAFTKGCWSGTDWLCGQSDSSLALLETIVGEVPNEEWEDICWNIGYFAQRLGFDTDLFKLLDRYGLAANAPGVEALHEVLEHEYDQHCEQDEQAWRSEREKYDRDDAIDRMLAKHGLTIPFPRGHPDRMWAANLAIDEHLYDPTSPESIARDDWIDQGLARLGLTVEFPRGHPLRSHAYFEAHCEHYGQRPDGRYPVKPPLPADTSPLPVKVTARSTDSTGAAREPAVLSPGSVLCSVEADAFRIPPRRARMEARKLPHGFEVWFRDEHLYPDGKVIATRDTDYNAQTFCDIIVSYFLNHDGMHIRPNAWHQARVTGERGLKATMLALAFTRGWWSDTGFLREQSDASLALLEAIAGEVIGGEWQKICWDIEGAAGWLNFNGDLLSLLERYGLPASAEGVKALLEPLNVARLERLG